jgi:hypothetical protein
MKLFLTVFASLALMLSPARFALRASVEVSGTMIFLSDLVSRDAPDYVREEAARIPLGLSPQTGATRILSGAAITTAIEHAGLPNDVFTVPDQVSVVRAGRKLSDQEVWAAMERYLKTHPESAIRAIQPDELIIDKGFSIPADARIEVERVTSDKTLRTVQVHLSVEGADSALPTCVRVRTKSSFPGETIAVVSRTAVIRTNAKLGMNQPALVDPKTIARLHLHSADSDMVLDVRPLERGALDQTIRVRLASSAKTLQARVVGANALDATF